jgi:hypothetical protein
MTGESQGSRKSQPRCSDLAGYSFGIDDLCVDDHLLDSVSQWQLNNFNVLILVGQAPPSDIWRGGALRFRNRWLRSFIVSDDIAAALG